MQSAHRSVEQIGKQSSEQRLSDSQLFAKPDDAWCDIARRAALDGEIVSQRLISAGTGRVCLVSASPVIHPGYCGFTMQDMESLYAVGRSL